jgi:hypothetical protein
MIILVNIATIRRIATIEIATIAIGTGIETIAIVIGIAIEIVNGIGRERGKGRGIVKGAEVAAGKDPEVASMTTGHAEDMLAAEILGEEAGAEAEVAIGRVPTIAGAPMAEIMKKDTAGINIVTTTPKEMTPGRVITATVDHRRRVMLRRLKAAIEIVHPEAMMVAGRIGKVAIVMSLPGKGVLIQPAPLAKAILGKVGDAMVILLEQMVVAGTNHVHVRANNLKA